jgi:sec-independent protein translocase protein TatC
VRSGASIAPELYRHEKRFALPFWSRPYCFSRRIAFAYWIVFPLIFEFFVHTAPQGVEVKTDITNYLDFVLVLVFSFGLTFEVPVVVVLLVTTGMVPVEKLTQIRGYVLIAVFVIAAILTPPDALSQTVMAIPMYLLYEGGILFARLLSKKKPAQQPG